MFFRKRKEKTHCTHLAKEPRERDEKERKKENYKTDDAMGGVVCLEFVPNDAAKELLFVNAHN